MSFYSESAISNTIWQISAASCLNRLMKCKNGSSWNAKCQAARTSSGESKSLAKTRLFSSVSHATLLSLFSGASFSCSTERRNNHFSLFLASTRPGTNQDPVIAERAIRTIPVRTGGVVFVARAVDGPG